MSSGIPTRPIGVLATIRASRSGSSRKSAELSGRNTKSRGSEEDVRRDACAANHSHALSADPYCFSIADLTELISEPPVGGLICE
jgi:hypothetical protein